MLDLSLPMTAEDVKPNRIIRAKQQIEDILKFGKGLRIGLIGFAKIPHLITPITDDFATILHLLPAIDVDLISKQGNDLKTALNMAAKALHAEPGNSKHILIISAGNFDDEAIDSIKKLTADNIYVHFIGVGTEEGAPYKDKSRSWYKANNKVVISKLNTAALLNMAKSGKGQYLQLSYNEGELITLLKQIINANSNKLIANSVVKQWEEGFFWLLFPMLILALIMQRKHLQLSMFILVVLLAMPQIGFALALFKNSEQQGEQYYKNGDYEKAAVTFTEPYRQGVALYKAGKFAEAEQAFKKIR